MNADEGLLHITSKKGKVNVYCDAQKVKDTMQGVTDKS